MKICKTCGVKICNFKKTLIDHLFPFSIENKQVCIQVQELLQFKSFCAYLFLTIFNAMRYFAKSQSWDIATNFYDENKEDIEEMEVRDFIETSLPILTYTIAITKALRIPMTLLYLKYPGIARTYFVFEMITNM